MQSLRRSLLYSSTTSTNLTSGSTSDVNRSKTGSLLELLGSRKRRENRIQDDVIKVGAIVGDSDAPSPDDNVGDDSKSDDFDTTPPKRIPLKENARGLWKRVVRIVINKQRKELQLERANGRLV
mmetsp:Transcript_429/g.616  ORF Transcript_429/g.616 Transcript_429/m.616 type:complete len:124 (+) Transcript_429:183-554(+)